MLKEEKEILTKAKSSGKGLHSPSDMISSYAGHNRGLVEDMVARGYLNIVPEVIHTGKSINFYRITERGLIQFDPLYKRLWFYFKGDLRTILVSLLTALVTSIATLWLGIS